MKGATDDEPTVLQTQYVDSGQGLTLLRAHVSSVTRVQGDAARPSVVLLLIAADRSARKSGSSMNQDYCVKWEARSQCPMSGVSERRSGN